MCSTINNGSYQVVEAYSVAWTWQIPADSSLVWIIICIVQIRKSMSILAFAPFPACAVKRQLLDYLWHTQDDVGIKRKLGLI